jgi:hypothetical protein
MADPGRRRIPDAHRPTGQRNVNPIRAEAKLRKTDDQRQRKTQS